MKTAQHILLGAARDWKAGHVTGTASSETLGGLLERVVRAHGPEPALLFKPRFRTEVWTYDRLWRESTRVACHLQRHGVGKGDRIVIWAPNSPWWVAAFFASARLGTVLVPLDIRSTPDFVRRVVEQSEPSLAVLSRLTEAAWEHNCPTLRIEDLEDAAMPPSMGAPAVYPDDLAEILFTSGTTGDPKGVMLTHANITSDAVSSHEVIPHLPYFRLLSVLPLSHMLEQGCGMLLPLLRGASIFYPPSRQSSILFRAFAEQRITTVIAVPQALQLFMDAIEREVHTQGKEETWRRLQTVAERLPVRYRHLLFRSVHRRLGGAFSFWVSGGAPLDPDLFRRWELLGIPVLQGYGSTETSPVITATSFDDHDPRTVGRPISCNEVRIASDGEVLVRGANVTQGYWRNPEATKNAFANGWYATGDLGELDARNYLYLRGRKKNLIVLANGQNVYPEDIEMALHATGKIRDALVLGLPGTGGGVRVHAVLLCDGDADGARIVHTANTTLAAHQQIQDFTLWPDADFPRTHTLKVKRGDVLERLSQREETRAQRIETAGSTEGTASPLLRLVGEAAKIPGAEITPDATLGEDCGLDSLSRVELLATIETELGIYLDEALIGPSTTVRDLQRLVDERKGGERPHFPSWPRAPLAQLGRRAVHIPTFAALERIAPARITGIENLDGLKEPVLLVANHTSDLDSPTLLHALPPHLRERVTVAAAADYFFSRRWLGVGVGFLLNAFPFSRTTAVRGTLEFCARLLDEGWSIVLYPEGTRSTTGDLAPFKAGVGLLAVELNVQVVPVRLHGLQQILPKGQTLPHRGEVAVSFGRPMCFEPGTPYDDATLAIHEAVEALSPIAMRKV